ncbi:hypothetical protein QFZ54_002810 [Sphingomonas faeni]|nr:hypothetical protein [Sphingomonas faeni]
MLADGGMHTKLRRPDHPNVDYRIFLHYDAASDFAGRFQ